MLSWQRFHTGVLISISWFVLLVIFWKMNLYPKNHRGQLTRTAEVLLPAQTPLQYR
ncbi:hypothetical protein B0H12DRAFT_1137804 [Mycena haematopus]|nr:hypothetical protein B0H12DRAFT_1137804 [Mycena haematopus]